MSTDSHPQRLTASIRVVPMSIVDGVPAILLSTVDGAPGALPGDRLSPHETLEAAAQRILATGACVTSAYVEQLYSFVTPNPLDETGTITIAYLALVPGDGFSAPLRSGGPLVLAEVVVPWPGEAGGLVEVCAPTGEPLALVEGDADILGQAMLRLRGKLDYSGVGFALLPDRFTLRQLQDVHEAILGVRLNKPAFRRRMLDKGWLEATGERETGASFRPAELYRYRPTKGA